MSKHFTLPPKVLSQHIGVLGKTGSGKTSTAKLIVESVVADGHRVCILDPIKSDWWGMTSDSSGKRPGLPFHILGGPHGHVPLHPAAGAAIGAVVASGALKLSIIDMADFDPGGPEKFFIAFAQALFKQVKGVVYLVIEEAHNFGPKERLGFGDQNLSIHWFKKLATASRSKGIRLIGCTHRTQDLHNAVLGSFETIIAHRTTLPADQKPIIDWLKGNTDKETTATVGGELSSLPTGDGWMCSGEAKIVQRQHFPRISTYDNSATPDGSKAKEVKTAPVNTEHLASIVGSAIEEAKANDPKELRKQVTELRAALAKAEHAKPVAAKTEIQRVDVPVVTDADLKRIDRAEEKVSAAVANAIDRIEKFASDHRDALVAAVEPFKALLERVKAIKAGPDPIALARKAADFGSSVASARTVVGRPVKPIQPRPIAGDGSITGPMQRILDSVAWWNALGVEMPVREAVAFVAGYAPNSGSFKNPVGALRSAGHVDYPTTGVVVLTAQGVGLASHPKRKPTKDEAIERVRDVLDGPKRKILDALIEMGGEAARDELAERAGYDPSSGSFKNPIGNMRSTGIVTYPAQGQVKIAEFLK